MNFILIIAPASVFITKLFSLFFYHKLGALKKEPTNSKIKKELTEGLMNRVAALTVES